MAIDKKLIHFGKLADFEAQLTAGNILDRSIVFIQDAKKIWTHGTYYDCSEGTAAGDIVQSDWNENDPVSDSYIQGRTHYSYDVEQIALFSIASKNEGDILVTGLYVGGFYKLYNQAGGKSQVFHFVEGRKVPIPSVGPPIEAVCTYEDDYCLKLTTPTYGMNESFSLMEMYVEQLKDIYVPETIARTSELKTINGESILGSGDLTIEGGAKVYTWNWDGSESGTLSQEEYDAINESDVVYVSIEGIPAESLKGYGDAGEIRLSVWELLDLTEYGVGAIIGYMSIVISSDKTYTIYTSMVKCPIKTSELENDSNFITSDGLKTINGESIVGSGNIEISGGGVSEDYVNTAIANAITTTLNTAV